MEIGKRIDETIRLGLAPLLKQQGFSKSGRNFHRLSGKAWQVVNVQASQGNSDASGKFTINVGVYVPEVAVLAGQAPIAGKPKEYECTVRERMGELMPGGADHWWALLPSTDLAVVATSVTQAVTAYGLPWLEAHASVEQVAQALASQPSVMSAAAALAAGDRDEAVKRIKRMEAERPMAGGTARAWAKKTLE